MQQFCIRRDDRVGLLKPAVDAHSLGVTSFAHILADCGYQCVVADIATCAFLTSLDVPENAADVLRWVLGQQVTVIGFSYRLDPETGAMLFQRFCRLLHERRLMTGQGGRVRGVFFAGLPEACRLARLRVPEVTGVFQGDETPMETLQAFGIPRTAMPKHMSNHIRYDEDRLAFGREIVRAESYMGTRPVDRGGYDGFGTRADTLVARLNHVLRHGQPPLMRAHVGPYMREREEAVNLFIAWARQLAASGTLDVLSIGTSQLSQSAFGEDWGDRPNGGGVPLNSAEEFSAVWHAARPMLVRTYAGTDRISALAAMYERTINIAWHALSFWWFCRLDGRGPLAIEENLQQHLDTLSFVASTGKPFEANVAHHFAFRGADDVTAIASAILAARTARRFGIRDFVLQVMLNTPKTTWGMQDLAKARAVLRLARELEDERFRVILQPRGGLDYFSPDVEKAKAQLAAVTALMDDIEPHDPASPPMIHVVSYSEANNLADPDTVNESVWVTRHALQAYRKLREKGEVDDMGRNAEVAARTEELVAETRCLLAAIETSIPNLYTARGLFDCFARGFLPVPDLWGERDLFPRAVAWKTRWTRGGVQLVNEDGLPLTSVGRINRVAGWDRVARMSTGMSLPA